MPKDMKVIRFSVSLPPTLVVEIDKALKKMGYDNRSKAIHDAVRSFIAEFRWMYEKTGKITGAILVLYYRDRSGLLEEIMSIQHRFRSVITSTTHIHLEENKCLEIIAVNGSTQKIISLTKELMARKGVKQVKVASMAP